MDNGNGRFNGYRERALPPPKTYRRVNRDRKPTPAPYSLPTTRPPPAVWKHFTEAQKLSYLLNMSLERCYEWLSLDRSEMDSVEKNIQTTVVRIVTLTCAKVGIETSRQQLEREKALARMVDALPVPPPRKSGDRR